MVVTPSGITTLVMEERIPFQGVSSPLKSYMAPEPLKVRTPPEKVAVRLSPQT